jgi:integrase
VRFHLREKEKSRRVTAKTLAGIEPHLQRAVDFFGAGRELHTVKPSDVRTWIERLRTTENGRGSTLTEKSVRDHLNDLSNLYRRAQSEEFVTAGYNPVAALLEKPKGRKKSESPYLEVPAAALLLEEAKRYAPPPDKHGFQHWYPLLATFLLTGARKAEVLGLEVRDVSFERQTITIRPNAWRDLKTVKSHRTVPMWPQLEEALRGYIGGPGPSTGLLFRSARSDVPAMITDLRKGLDAIGTAVGFAPGEIRTKVFRHTYTSARLQTVENGYPVSHFTVMREMGHASLAMIERVYGHLGNVRHRSEVVEYRVEQHEEALKDRERILKLVAA